MTKVMSPRLVQGVATLYERDGDCFACVDWLRTFFDIPKARYYWLEGSDRQWKDRSGVAITVSITVSIDDEHHLNNCHWFEDDGTKHPLWDNLASYLKRLGIVPCDKPKTIYFRFWYQE